MKRFILITAGVELLAGLVLFLYPQAVPDLAQGQHSHLAMARMYGAAAMGLGIFALQVWQNAENKGLVKTFLSSFLVFHFSVFIALFASFLAGVFANPAAALLHLILGGVTAYFFFKNSLADLPRGRKIGVSIGIVVGVLGLFISLLPTLLHQAGLHPDYMDSKSYDLQGKKALIITTSHSVLHAHGETAGDPTGVFASEMTVPYYEFLDAGMEVDVASIQGGEIPIDQQSFLFMIKSKADKRYLKDKTFQGKVKNSLKIDGVDFTTYDAIWMAGGWGAAYDLGQSAVLGEKVSQAYYAESPIIGSVCHGALGLIQAKDTLGNFLITGRTMTGVTDKQLEELGITLTPLHPETELRKLGVDFRCQSGNQDIFQTLTVVDREQRFVTGQNQNSGHETAQKMMRIISENSSKSMLD